MNIIRICICSGKKLFATLQIHQIIVKNKARRVFLQLFFLQIFNLISSMERSNKVWISDPTDVHVRLFWRSYHCEAGKGYWLQGEAALQAQSFREADPQPVIPTKKTWLELARNSYKWQDWSGFVWTWTEMYLNDWTFLWMAGNGFEWPKRAGNSWKQKCCLLLRLQSTCTQHFYWTFAALCPPLCSLATSPYAEKVWMLRVSTASVLSRTGPSCGSALKWALADWCCYGFCRLESQNQQCYTDTS